ncbi:MAG: 16S rRNA (uracil(1498)-N(3))-methyltransferase [Labilithrix sp.]|nr:16S rRNA (uracil(1498)-N(3))-methyltransferase [Labilithrix sp.]MCW5812229.1 16S rRNA (uracil(1498)-N(3))-methyltransferase [Labilithrix sp.]
MIRAPIAGLASGVTTIAPETARYLVKVRRLRAGDAFVAFDPVTRMEADAVLADERTARIAELRAAAVVAERDLVLVYALAKGDKVDGVVRDATELGATRVLVARSERSIVKADAERAEAKRARWERVAEQAARQCGRADPPAIEGVLDWPAALTRAATCDARFCLDPHAPDALGPLLAPSVASGASIAFAIGPEGGLTREEIDVAGAAGFVAVSLGRFVLRTETVAAALLGAVRVLTH